MSAEWGVCEHFSGLLLARNRAEHVESPVFSRRGLCFSYPVMDVGRGGEWVGDGVRSTARELRGQPRRSVSEKGSRV